MSGDRGRAAVLNAEIEAFRTRGAVGADYHLITASNRAFSGLPELTGATVCKLVTPRRSPARFAQYLLELEPAAGTSAAVASTASEFEHFLYGIAGSAMTRVAGNEQILSEGRFAYLTPGEAFELWNPSNEPGRLLWIKRRHQPVTGLESPPSCAGDRSNLPESEYLPGLWRTELIGQGDPRHDFAMIRMRFEPSVDLGMVEVHDEEHGLYMTAGTGVYLLGADRHHVEEGDFVYMAPYCPQSFMAGAETGGEYLLYKDTFRDGF